MAFSTINPFFPRLRPSRPSGMVSLINNIRFPHRLALLDGKTDRIARRPKGFVGQAIRAALEAVP